MEISLIFGTRPEVIKMAPIIHAARRRGHRVQVIFTGQHRELTSPLLEFFDIAPDIDLDVMTHNQTLQSLSERIISRLNLHQDRIRPDALLVQGDTTSAFVAAYWAMCRKIPVGHVEAGLRTYDLQSPFPEEANRQLIGRIASFHFAPTLQSAKALQAEQIKSDLIHWVGNTAIDALCFTLERIRSGEVPDSEKLDADLARFIGDHKLVLVTAHRRESFGPAFEGICDGILSIAEAREDVRVLYPVHPNPNVREVVFRKLQGHPRIRLCDPISYVKFVHLMSRADVLLTDSGGIQEEGPTLRKPILVMRDCTERPEGIDAGFAELVGTSAERIRDRALLALSTGLMTENLNPYGDGQSSERIVSILDRNRRMPLQPEWIAPVAQLRVGS